MGIAPKQNIIILGNSSSFASAILIDTWLKVLKKNENHFQLAGIFDAAVQPPATVPQKIFQKVVMATLRWGFDHRKRPVFMRPFIGNLYSVAQKHRVTIEIPPSRDINHRDFVSCLENLSEPAIILSMGCLQIYKKPILDAVRSVINYHNGRLPYYKGLHATSWECYKREPHVGYTFHYMDEKIDEGNILMEGKIPVGNRSDALRLEYEKAYMAATDVEVLLSKIYAESPGSPQKSKGSYYSEKDFNRIRTIDDPHAHTFKELCWRLECFSLLNLRIADQVFPVTRIERVNPAGGKSGRHHFHTQDRVTARATRFAYLPYSLRRTLKSIRR